MKGRSSVEVLLTSELPLYTFTDFPPAPRNRVQLKPGYTTAEVLLREGLEQHHRTW